MKNTRLRAIDACFSKFVLGSDPVALYTENNFLILSRCPLTFKFLAVIVVLPRCLCKGRHSIAARNSSAGFGSCLAKLLGGYVIPLHAARLLQDELSGRAEAVGKMALFQVKDKILDRHLKQVLPLSKHPPVDPSILRMWDGFWPNIWAHDIVKEA